MQINLGIINPQVLNVNVLVSAATKTVVPTTLPSMIFMTLNISRIFII